MLSCREATRLLSEGLDRELPLRQRVSLRLHVMMCSACRAYGRQIEALSQLASKLFRSDRYPDISEDRGLSDDSRQRIKETLRRHIR